MKLGPIPWLWHPMSKAEATVYWFVMGRKWHYRRGGWNCRCRIEPTRGAEYEP